MSDNDSDLPGQFQHLPDSGGDIPGLGNVTDLVSLGPKQDDPTTPPGGQYSLGPKQDDPVALGPKQDDPVALGPKQDDPVALGPKQDDPVALGPKQDDPVALGPKQDDPVALGPKQDDPVALGPKQDDPVALGPKQDDPTAYGDPAAPGGSPIGPVPTGGGDVGGISWNVPTGGSNPFTDTPRDGAPIAQGGTLVNPIGPGGNDRGGVSAPAKSNNPFDGGPGLTSPVTDPTGRGGLLRGVLIGLLVIVLLAGGGIVGVSALNSASQCSSPHGNAVLPTMRVATDCTKQTVPTGDTGSSSQPTVAPTVLPTDTPAALPTDTPAPVQNPPVLSAAANVTYAYCYDPGHYAATTITIQNTGAGTLHWSAVTDDPTNAVTSPASGAVNAGQSQTISLAAAPSQTQHSTSTLTVTVSSDGGNKSLIFNCKPYLA